MYILESQVKGRKHNPKLFSVFLSVVRDPVSRAYFVFELLLQRIISLAAGVLLFTLKLYRYD